MSTRLGSIILVMFTLNMMFVVANYMGMPTGGINSGVSVVEANATYQPTNITSQINVLGLSIDVLNLGMIVNLFALFTSTLGTLSGYTMFNSLFTIAVGSSAAVSGVALIFTIIMNVVVFYGLVQWVRTGEAGL